MKLSAIVVEEVVPIGPPDVNDGPVEPFELVAFEIAVAFVAEGMINPEVFAEFAVYVALEIITPAPPEVTVSMVLTLELGLVLNWDKSV